MIKVVFEFKTVEEAIATLGKVMAGASQATGAPVTPAANAQAGGAVPPATPTEKTTRKPRADAGKPRGAHRATPEAPQAGTPTGSAAGVDASPPVVAPKNDWPLKAPESTTNGAEPQAQGTGATSPEAGKPSEPAAPPTLEEAQKAMEAYFNAKGITEAQALLAIFQVKRVAEIKPEARADFIKAATV